ncbi:hypothetical protein GALL_503460 [mine drainage metagenome]|uniref:Uncharacterized protein n=1 Tax=mine drainage metagenome TaxID=410659 RepID=A0A1J5PWS4_9ZZZZ
MSLRAWLLALVAALGGGFIAGRWSIPHGKPIPLIVGPSRALPEHDLSPAGQVRTVIVTRIVPGKPAAPPAPVPPELGQHLETTDTTLSGGILHDALFGRVEGQRLTLRNVQWLDTPTGPGTLGDTRTITAPVSLLLPAPPAPPRWGALALAGLQNGRPVYGAALEYWRGPVGLQVGTVGNVVFAGAGVRW